MTLLHTAHKEGQLCPIGKDWSTADFPMPPRIGPRNAEETVVSQTLDSGRNSVVDVGWLLTADRGNVN